MHLEPAAKAESEELQRMKPKPMIWMTGRILVELKGREIESLGSERS